MLHNRCILSDVIDIWRIQKFRTVATNDFRGSIQYNTNQIYNARKVTPKCESEARMMND